MAKFIDVGVKFVADASDLDVKCNKSVEQLNASLTKTQKTLGLTYNENRLLTDALGRCVEGLSTAQIKTGSWVDELGRVRTHLGGFTDGVSRTLLAMGAYSDEIGNIYNASGELIGQTEKLARALEREEAEGARKAAEAERALAEGRKAADDAFAGTVDGVSQLSGQFAVLLGALASADDEFSDFQRGLISVAEGVAAGGQAFQTLRGLKEAVGSVSFLELTNSGKAAIATFRGLSLGTTTLRGAFAALRATSGPLLPILGAVATGVFAFWATSKAEANSADLLSESFKKLEALAKAAGKEIRGVKDALELGAFAEPKSALDEAAEKVAAAEKKIEETKARFAESAGRAGGSGAGFGAAGMLAAVLEPLEAERKNAIAEYNDAAKTLVDEARRAQQTESERLEAQRAQFAEILKYAEAENRGVIERQITELTVQIAAAKAKEAEAANASAVEAEKSAQAAKTARDAAWQTLFQSTGVDGTESKPVSLADAQADWADALAAGIVGQKEYDAALRTLTEQTREKLGVEKTAGERLAETTAALVDAFQNGALDQAEFDAKIAEAREASLADLGYSDLLARAAESTQKAQTAQERYQAELDKYADALEKGRVNQKEYDKAVAAAKTIFDREAAAEKASEREKTRSELGVDAALDALKTPLDKFEETTAKIAAAFERGDVDAQERAALEQKAQNEYARATESQEKTAERAASKPESEKAAASLREGSVDLYRAQIQGERSFQTKIGSATERAAQATAATVPATTQTANAVATVAATVAPKATEESSFWAKALEVLESIRDAATETRSSSDATAGTLDKILRNAAEVFG
ncbi:MAG: hypothetical protein IJO40_09730 [Thermoguttaceae bacterium]|nr:hypothetical protein [Thermoguttaceae bacterium]